VSAQQSTKYSTLHRLKNKFRAALSFGFVDTISGCGGAHAWPAHPDWLAKFLKVLGTCIEA
jgi:hypothetical protein